MGAVLPSRSEHDPGEWCAIPISPEHAPDTHPDVLDAARAGERWSVLYTHSHCERLLARACEQRSIRHYLPLAEQWLGPDHARRRAIAPLFPSYLFVCMSEVARRDLLQVGHLARMLPVPQPDLLLAELRQVRDALTTGANCVVGPVLESGVWVRVLQGPMAGVLGRVEGLRRRKRRHRLVLNVSVLGRGVAIEIDALRLYALGRGRVEHRLGRGSCGRCCHAPRGGESHPDSDGAEEHHVAGTQGPVGPEVRPVKGAKPAQS